MNLDDAIKRIEALERRNLKLNQIIHILQNINASNLSRIRFLVKMGRGF